VKQAIDELSIDSYTHDGDYMWWIQNLNGTYFMRWEPKPSTIDNQIDETDCFSFNPQKTVYDVKNFLYLSCGSDDDGFAIREHVMDFNSVADVGFKEDVYAYPDAAREARDLGLNGNTLITFAKNSCKIQGQTRLKHLTQPRWKADLELRGTTDYNLASQVYVFSQGLGGDWTANGQEINPNTDTNYQGYKLRIMNIEHKFSEIGWRTTLNLEEDPELIQ